MESRDWEEEAARAGWIEVQGLKKGEAAGKTPSREEEVTPLDDLIAVLALGERERIPHGVCWS